MTLDLRSYNETREEQQDREVHEFCCGVERLVGHPASAIVRNAEDLADAILALATRIRAVRDSL